MDSVANVANVELSQSGRMPRDRPGAEIAQWLIASSLEGVSTDEMLEGFCERLLTAGFPIHRFHVTLRALHPVFGSIGFDWYRDTGVVKEHYIRSADPPASWIVSPFFHMLSEGVAELRQKLTDENKPFRFPILEQFERKGAKDYFATVMPFSGRQTGGVDPNNAPEGCILSVTTDRDNGFYDADIDMIRRLLPALGLALKSNSNRQMAQDLMEIYLGANAGSRVLSGEIQRGSFETTDAVIWCFDLQNFTRLSETHSGPQIIAMLNDYFAAVVDVIDSHGGNVLKFMGDGILAVFDRGARRETCIAAIEAAHDAEREVAQVSNTRQAEDLPVTGYHLAVHAGNVQYGNIGAQNRLDFTVIGSAVNSAVRILGMCRPLECDVVISSTVARAIMPRDDLVSLGRYMLRGVSEPQELFTLYRPAQ